MSKIKWTDDFSVHDEQMDDQHKKWIEIYNKAHGLMINGAFREKDFSIGKQALTEMIEYTKFHFACEEKYMEKIKFPKRKDHKNKHDFFVLKLDRLSLQINQGIFILNSEVIKIIENWFIDHILKEDMEFKSVKPNS